MLICLLQPSDIIEIIGIVASLLTSIIAIIISLKTLRQNSKMIEDSSRPYIGIYGGSTFVSTPNYYLILKNFGNSSATIKKFSSNIDLSKFNTHNFDDRKPFQNIEGSTIMPGQSFHAVIDFKKAYSKSKTLNFYIVYSSGTHTYEDNICVNLAANIGNFVTHHTAKGKEIATISETLQDISIRSL